MGRNKAKKKLSHKEMYGDTKESFNLFGKKKNKPKKKGNNSNFY